MMIKANDTPPDWSALIDAARGGCDEALGQIVSRLRSYLLLIAERGLGNSVQAKFGASDVIQHSMLDARKSIVNFHGNSEAELRHWLKKIVIHNLTDQARQYTNTQSRDVAREVEILDSQVAQNASAGDTPSHYVRRNEEDEELLRAVARLPHRQRQVVEARHRDSQTYEQIAAQLQISEVAARRLWSRAVAQLREWLGPDSQA